MAIKEFKPTTPARRGMTSQDLETVTDFKGPKKLRTVKKQQAGRNNQGRITVRHRGGGAKKFIRNLTNLLPDGYSGKIVAIEYDPNRSARIARLEAPDGQQLYILAASGMKVGQKVQAGPEAPVEKGNQLPLANIPDGTYVYNVELQRGKGGQMVRSAGASAQLMAKEGNKAQLRLPSGEVRIVGISNVASIGAVGNEQHQNIKMGSAGRRRRKGWRPSVRGKAMNAVDHPLGGGDGGAHGAGRPPKTPWGKKALGYKTRRRKSTDKYIVRTRHEAKRR
ncbi:MAG: 50S ribosomal protein L2 [Candidatus Saccharimonadales bacterium]|nr:50S ribosomal protein L2 [Candidatus Saccharimonadales bacterium]